MNGLEFLFNWGRSWGGGNHLRFSLSEDFVMLDGRLARGSIIAGHWSSIGGDRLLDRLSRYGLGAGRRRSVDGEWYRSSLLFDLVVDRVQLGNLNLVTLLLLVDDRLEQFNIETEFNDKSKSVTTRVGVQL